jgi:hypothetical protein
MGLSRAIGDLAAAIVRDIGPLPGNGSCALRGGGRTFHRWFHRHDEARQSEHAAHRQDASRAEAAGNEHVCLALTAVEIAHEGTHHHL